MLLGSFSGCSRTWGSGVTGTWLDVTGQQGFLYFAPVPDFSVPMPAPFKFMPHSREERNPALSVVDNVRTDFQHIFAGVSDYISASFPDGNAGNYKNIVSTKRWGDDEILM